MSKPCFLYLSFAYDLVQASSVDVYVNNQLISIGSSSAASITAPNTEGNFTVVLKAVNAQCRYGY